MMNLILSKAKRPKVVLLWQTFHISTHHVLAWIDCQLRGIDCIFLLNNENGIYDRVMASKSLPRGCGDSIFPFDHNSYLNLRLPLLPYKNRQLKTVNYYNSDYGFYLANSKYAQTSEDIFFVKVDHDVMLYGLSWPQFLDLLPIDLDQSLTLHRETSSPQSKWHWHPSSSSVYGNYFFGLFGLQGVSNKYLPLLLDRRREIFAKSIHYNDDHTCDDVPVTQDLDFPICEAFFETELARLGVNPIELFKLYPHIKKSFTLEVIGGLASVDLPSILRENPNAPFWLFHPWKVLPM